MANALAAEGSVPVANVLAPRGRRPRRPVADGAPALARSWLTGCGHELRSWAGRAGGLVRLGRREEPAELGRPSVEEVLMAAGCGLRMGDGNYCVRAVKGIRRCV
jgi:hypothetical protein